MLLGHSCLRKLPSHDKTTKQPVVRTRSTDRVQRPNDHTIKQGNNSNTNIQDNVYSDVIITAIVSVQPDHLMNVGQRQVSANTQTKPINLGRESAYELLSSTPTIAVNYYSARKLIHILPYHGG